MTPLKLARIHVCGKCENHRNDPTWPWPRCAAAGRELGDDAFDGPASDCPAGLWDDIRVDPVDEFRAIPKRFSDGQAAPAVPSWLVRAVAERSAICDACDVETCPLKRCAGCRRRNILSRPNMVCPADPPKWGPISKPRRLKVVWTISAWNEPLIAATVKGLYDSIIDREIDFEVLVVDDASTDGSCENLSCRVLRNSTPLGIGRNLNAAADYATSELGADVVGVADAHMKIPPGVVGALARRAACEICVTSSAAFGWEEHSKMKQWGAYLVWQRRDLIAARWIGSKWPRQADGNHMPADEWARVQVPLGAFYAYSRETIAALSTPTGRLWETVAGRWGFLLEPFSVKCCLLDVPVYVSRDHYTRHLYRSSNPVKTAHREKVRNIAFGAAGIFSRGTWEKHFGRWCRSRSGVTAEEVDALAEEARRGVTLPWTSEEEEDFLKSLPEIEEEKKNPIPLQKICLMPPRDKMIRATSVRRKDAQPRAGVAGAIAT